MIVILSSCVMLCGEQRFYFGSVKQGINQS